MINNCIMSSLIKFIIFNEDGFKGFNDGCFDDYVVSDEFIQELHQLVIEMCDNQYLDENIKNKLLNLIDHMRFDLKIGNEKINDMISKINTSLGNNIKEYYKIEIANHFIKPLCNLEKEMSRLVAYDNFVVFSHTLFANEDFEDSFDSLIGIVDYYYAISYLAVNYIDLFTVVEFRERFKRIIETNNKLSKYSTSRNFKRLTKKYYKNLKDL